LHCGSISGVLCVSIPRIEPEGFSGISFCDDLQAERRWQTRTLHVPDFEVFEDQAKRSAAGYAG
jgi:hypothetical protein